MRPGTILERLGTVQAERLALKCGGTRIYVPVSMRFTRTLGARVGLDLALLLIAEFPGEQIYIPMANPTSRRVNRKAIVRLSRQGLSASTIARRLGCSIRAVHANRKEPTS